MAASLARGRDKVWLAELDGELVGYAKVIWVEPRHQARLGPSDGVRSGFHLMGVEVAQEARRRGIGRALTLARIEWAAEQGARELFYVTRADNHGSLALHEELGFERVGEVQYPSIRLDGEQVLSRLELRPELPLRIGHDVGMEPLLQLYDSVGWSAYTVAPETLGEALAGSAWVATRWDGERLVALARVMSDDATMAYLQDILVDPAYQGRGLGRAMGRLALDRFDHVRQFMVLTDDRPKQAAFYRSLGLVDIEGSPLRFFARMPGLS